MNINDGNNDWIKTSMAGTYNFVGMYRDYPVYKVSYHIILSQDLNLKILSLIKL